MPPARSAAAIAAALSKCEPPTAPRPIVDKLSAAAQKALPDREVVQRLAGLGVEIIGDSANEFGHVIRSDLANWGKVVKDLGAKAD